MKYTTVITTTQNRDIISLKLKVRPH